MWPALKVLIIVVWVLASTLLVRNVYFPEGSQLAEVPASVVLKMFIEHGTELNSMFLFHGDQKIGFASVNARKVDGADRRLYAEGKIDKGAIPGANSEIVWHIDVPLLHGEAWGGMVGQLSFPSTKRLLSFRWNKDEKLPHFALKEKSEVIMNNEMAGPLLAQVFAGQGSAVLPGGATLDTANADGLFQMNAREGTLKLAGQKQHGYVLEFTVMETYHAKAFFTEAGELALVELPDGYRLLESTVYNLEPGLDDEEDKPGA